MLLAALSHVTDRQGRTFWQWVELDTDGSPLAGIGPDFADRASGLAHPPIGYRLVP